MGRKRPLPRLSSDRNGLEPFRNAVHRDLALLERLEAVHAFDEGRFSAARWAANDHYLAFLPIGTASSRSEMPSTVISPSWNGSRPFTHLMKVDFPLPDGPQTTTTSPFFRSERPRAVPKCRPP